MNLRDKIWDWAERLDDRQNDLLRRVYEKGQLEDIDRQEVYNNLKATILDREELNDPVGILHNANDFIGIVTDDTLVGVFVAPVDKFAGEIIHRHATFGNGKAKVFQVHMNLLGWLKIC